MAQFWLAKNEGFYEWIVSGKEAAVKKTLLLSLLAALLALGLPWLQSRGQDAAAAPAPELTVVGLAPEPEGPRPENAALPAARMETETLTVLTDEGEREMDMRDYLVGVLAAEMPASFEPEALKAQAVAARSYARYQALSGKHGAAQVCTDPRCCQAWLSEEALRDRWGGQYEENLARIRAAVEATAGETLRWNGQPVCAVFHAASAGATEDSAAIWSARPYLVSVSSPETAAEVPGYISYVQCTALDFRDTVLSARPEADFSGPAELWLGETRRDASGRVAEVEVGGVTLSGTELRALFSLRSTAFTLECLEGAFRFTVIGSGHGVGMSQYGAQVMAQNGADYCEILAHYYPGTTLVN